MRSWACCTTSAFRDGEGTVCHVGAPNESSHGHVQKTLMTSRLTMRAFTLDDVDHLVALDRDPLVRRWVDDGSPATAAAARTSIESWLEHARRYRNAGCWAAEDRTSGQFIGWFHLFATDRDPAGERSLGYRLRRSSWGHGLATEGARALIDHAFAAPTVRSVTAETLAVHMASRRVMEKSGMRYVRTFRSRWPIRLPGDGHGDVEYEVIRPRWRTGVERPGS